MNSLQYYSEDHCRKHNRTIPELNVLEQQLIIYTTPQRITLLIINATLAILAIVGNIFVLATLSKRKNRYFYKCCLISLAVADLMIAVFTGAQHIDGLSEAEFTWKLGEFMCHFIPFDQITSLLASSLSLTCIALDRYFTIIKALQFKWDPKLYTSILVICTVWITSAGIAYPMWGAYVYVKMNVYDLSPDNSEEVTLIEIVHRCMASKSSKIFNSKYFACLFCFIFVPLLATFLFMYIRIAILVWRRQKPLNNNQISSTNNTSTSEQFQSDSKKSRNSMKLPQEKIETSAYGPSMAKKSSVQRNKRTFTILLILMSIFFFCNLPTFIIMFLEMFNDWNSQKDWILVSTIHILPICCSVLNPIFYTFLNETINYTKQIKKYGGIFCCKKELNVQNNVAIIIEEHPKERK